jgi:hypothetical protein
VGKILLLYAFGAFLSIVSFCFSEKMLFLTLFTDSARADLLPRNRVFSRLFRAVFCLYSAPFYAFFATRPLRFFTRVEAEDPPFGASAAAQGRLVKRFYFCYDDC